MRSGPSAPPASPSIEVSTFKTRTGSAVHRVVQELTRGGDARVLGERSAQVLPPVVIARDRMDRHREGLEDLAHRFVLRGVAVVGEVAGQEDGDGRRVQLADRGDRLHQRIDRIGVVGMEADMGVGDLRDRR